MLRLRNLEVRDVRRGAREASERGCVQVSITCLTTACVVIENGEVGVTKSFGAIGDEPLPAGVAFVAPVVRQVETWDERMRLVSI